MTTTLIREEQADYSAGEVKIGFKMRWHQPGHGESTGTRIFHDLDELLDICQRRTKVWASEGIVYWPVKVELTEKGAGAKEIEELRHLVGLSPRKRTPKEQG